MEIPEYLSIKDWKYFNSLEHLSHTEKMIAMLSRLGGVDENELKKHKANELSDAYKTLLEAFQDMKPQFYPIIELDGVLYGYTPMSKMALGEYVDLERLANKSNETLEEIMAILYRPITKHKFSGLKWAYKNKTKIALGEAENLFNYYNVEEYDSSQRKDNADKLSVIPASMALGALSFFLVVGTSLSLGTQISSLPADKGMKIVEKMNKQMASMNIGDGLLQFIIYLQHPSLTSQDRKVSQSSISSLYLTSWPMNRIKPKEMNSIENNKKELIKLDNGE